HLHNQGKRVLLLGSSPRAWGTPSIRWLEILRTTVHPHARGEHAEGCRDRGHRARFIPTRVGNTLPSSR
ncbi:MAG: hypothetical protein ACYDDO_13725, partial [Acidiferrobacterales bacterium]